MDLENAFWAHLGIIGNGNYCSAISILIHVFDMTWQMLEQDNILI